MKKRTCRKIFAAVCLMCALLAAGLVLAADGVAEKQPAQKPKTKKSQQDSPVTSTAPPIYVPDPVTAPPPVIYNYDEPSLITIPMDGGTDGGLTPLQEPSEALGGLYPQLIGVESVMPGFDPVALTEMRKRIGGVLYFEDREQHVWRVQPKTAGPRRLLDGLQPAADFAGRRLLCVEWTVSKVNLILYDISKSTKKVVFSTPDLISQPRFSPDGTAAVFMLISVTNGSQSLYRVDLATGAATPLVKNLRFYCHAWNPVDRTIWITVRECPKEMSDGSFCYASYNPATKKLEYKSLGLKDLNKGYFLSLEMFIKKYITFSKNGRLIVYDGNGDSDFFFVVDVEAKTAEKRYFRQPDGTAISPANVQWGPDNESIAMNYKGNVWVKIPDVEQPFPAVVGYFIDSPVSWTQ